MDARGRVSRARRRLDRGGAAFADSAVDRRRLLRRRDAELAVEDANAVAVLGERQGALAARAVEADQPAVRGFVERIEREPAAGVLDRADTLSARRAAVGETVEDGSELA